MLGAIVGDIAGSRFEVNNIKTKDFELFTNECRMTDDGLMTIAVGKALIEAKRFAPIGVDPSEKDIKRFAIKYMQSLGRQYINAGFGGNFYYWLLTDNPEPYGSFGNGAAMRVSPVGYFARTKEEVKELSRMVTEISHDHEEGIKGAESTSMAVYMARRGYTKSEIREEMKGYYNIDFSLEDIRESYSFDVTCQGSVPQAIVAFLEASSFEDAIRNAISIGGDSDTIAAIAGAIAAAYYGVPDDIREKALTYLDSHQREYFDDWEGYEGDDLSSGRYKVLTKYISKLDWRYYCYDDYDKLAPIALEYTEDLKQFTISDEIVNELLIELDKDDFLENTERTIELLKELREKDYPKKKRKVETLTLRSGSENFEIRFGKDHAVAFYSKKHRILTDKEVSKFKQVINSVHFEHWMPHYTDKPMLFEIPYTVGIKYEGQREVTYTTINYDPHGFNWLTTVISHFKNNGDITELNEEDVIYTKYN